MAMSCLLGQPIRVSQIRAGRDKPGLRPQHLTGIQVEQMVMCCGGVAKIMFTLEKPSDWSDFATVIES